MPVVAMIAMLGVSATDPPACPALAATYEEVGVVERGGAGLPTGGEVSLSLAVFRQAMPGLVRPEAVSLAVSPGEPVLRVTLAGQDRLERTWPVTCADGEYRIQRTRQDLPAGEGVDLVRETETLVLEPDATGLRVRVISQARYRTWPFFHRTETVDDQYRFARKAP